MRTPPVLHPCSAALLLASLLGLTACSGGGGGSSTTDGGSNPPPANLPTVASVVPPVALPGQIVLLTGSNLTGATSVKFGGATAASFAVVDATHLRVVVPGGAASGSLVVTSAAGSGPGFNFTIPSRTYTGSFTATGSLARGRYEHQALLLPGGKVLAMGGSYNTGPNAATWTNACEVFDPATGSWTATGSMPTGRLGFNAHLLPNGKVVAIGNDFNYTGIETADVYDPAAGTWTRSGAMLTKRWSFPSVMLSDGRILAIGGLVENGPYTAICEIFDPASGTWSATGSLNIQRRASVALLLPDGRVFTAGGLNGTSGDLTSTELYDPATGTWTAGPTLPGSRLDGAVLAPDGKVLLRRASDLFVLDLAAGICAVVADPAGTTVSRSWSGTTLLPGGRMLQAGGRTNSPLNGSVTSQLFDPASRTFTATGDLTVARDSSVAVLLPDGSVLNVGGCTFGSTTPGTCELFR